MSKWEKVKLGKLYNITSGGTPSKKHAGYYENGHIPWVRTGDLKNKYITVVDGMITEEGLNNSSAKIFPKNTVLLAMYGATIGACSILKIEAATNQACAAFLPNEIVDISYLYYFFCSSKNTLINLGIGGAQPNISATLLKELYIPLPSLEVQKKISKKLDTVSELLDLRKKQLEELDGLIKSVYYDMFGDLIANNKGWEIHTFNEVALVDTKMTKDFHLYSDFPHIGIDSIEKNTGEIIDYQLVKDGNIISGKYIFSSDHILYSKIRPNLNKVAIPSFHGLCSADAYPILAKIDKANKYYLAYTLRSDFFLNYILDFSGRTNIPKVNKIQLEGFTLPIPSLSLQNQFADIVIKIDEQKSLVKQSIQETQQLFDSLMSQYFD